MGAKLLYRDGQGRDASVDLSPSGSFLGRAVDCIVRTEDAMVSRKNCRIALLDGRWVVEDLGSSNGTFVNEARIQRQVLRHADVIRCGLLQVRFVETADAKPQQPGRPPTLIDAPAPQRPRQPTPPPPHQRQPTPSPARPQSQGASVQVDPVLAVEADPGGRLAQKEQQLSEANRQREELEAKLTSANREIETINSRLEAEAEELRRLRADSLQMRERHNELSRQKLLVEEELQAQNRVSRELHDELTEVKADYLNSKSRLDKLSEDVLARDRQLERTREEGQRAKSVTDELRAKLTELEKTKDEGWRELNNRVSELDHLREVIAGQERLLEERRVGLMALESAAQEARAERERTLREATQFRTEREELREKTSRMQLMLDTVQEENRRLVRALSEGGGAQVASGSNEHMRLAGELREAKVSLRTAETERSRLQEKVAQMEREQADLDKRQAHLAEDDANLKSQLSEAESGRRRAEETLAKTETARQRLEEERKSTATIQQGLRRELDVQRQANEEERRLRSELEARLQAAANAAPPPDHTAELEAQRRELAAERQLRGELEERLRIAEAGAVVVAMQSLEATPVTGTALPTEPHAVGPQVAELEAKITELEIELAAARATANKPQDGSNDALLAGLKETALNAYQEINDQLAELRTNVYLVRDLVSETAADPALTEAVAAVVERTDEAKNILYTLKEVI